MKSKNVSLAVEIYPREGTETRWKRFYPARAAVEIYPREGTETPKELLHKCPIVKIRRSL